MLSYFMSNLLTPEPCWQLFTCCSNFLLVATFFNRHDNFSL